MRRSRTPWGRSDFGGRILYTSCFYISITRYVEVKGVSGPLLDKAHLAHERRGLQPLKFRGDSADNDHSNAERQPGRAGGRLPSFVRRGCLWPDGKRRRGELAGLSGGA